MEDHLVALEQAGGFSGNGGVEVAAELLLRGKLDRNISVMLQLSGGAHDDIEEIP